MDAADLLEARLCTARCLLAMETPPGWAGCSCVCDGRYHATLIDAPVTPIREIRDQHGTTLGIRSGLREAS